MKTAISLPDELFHRAEATAQALHVSRSHLYAEALADYLNRQQPDAITERLNKVYSGRPVKLDPAFRRAQLKSLGTESW